MLVQVRKILGNMMSLRLFIAFVIGLLVGLFVAKIGANFENAVPYLLFPLLIGAVGASTVGISNLHPYRTALGTGLLIWLGISLYLFISASQLASQTCSAATCEGGNADVHAALLFVYLLGSFSLVALAAFMTRALMKQPRPAPQRW